MFREHSRRLSLSLRENFFKLFRPFKDYLLHKDYVMISSCMNDRARRTRSQKCRRIYIQSFKFYFRTETENG
ncbi:hypothetical protein SAMN05216210_1380 [Halopseudomonas salegens]|uniref:Uncharacterized protein n=1 Tax=Halopseudomonas salegens TaxID=1434072 RepID=A0A1H2F8W2_9GAMM|nr:hypothetical protein SAMN05216210_1380 [Halopseudomonas salegens]